MFTPCYYSYNDSYIKIRQAANSCRARVECLTPMSKLKTVGVLGGMGPQATILFQQRILAAVEAEDDADHLPLIIDMNPQVPSRLRWLLENKGEDPTPTLVKMARGLETAGAQALVMPCNTAHHFAPQIAAAVDIPFIDMVNRSSCIASKHSSPGDQVGILASPATDKIKLFENALSFYQLRALYPTNPVELLACIRRIKSNGATVADEELLATTSKLLEQSGASCLVVGCSEFSLITDAIQVDIPVIDTIDVLVNEVLNFSTS